MSVKTDALVHRGAPMYLAISDSAITDYYPAWLNNLADDVTIEGSMLDGAVQGPENIRAIIAFVRTLYGDSQKFRFVGLRSDGVFVEDYTTQVDGMPLGGVVTIMSNERGQTQHIVASYRPRSSVLHFSRLLGAKFVDTAFGDQFATGEEVQS